MSSQLQDKTDNFDIDTISVITTRAMDSRDRYTYAIIETMIKLLAFNDSICSANNEPTSFL
jgi:hypothetical protein